MYRPYISDNDSTTGSESSGASSRETSGDEQMEAMERWRTQITMPVPARTAGPQGDDRVPGDTGLGLYNSTLKFEQKRVTHVVMVDSLDRDQHVYPLPTQVRLKLPRVYRNVERIDIVQVKFFCGLYTISDALKNNVFDLSGVPITIPNGAYTLQQLIASLQGLLQSADPTKGFAVNFSPVTGRITISGSSQFSLELYKSPLPPYVQSSYSEWGLGWNLGWNGQPTDLSGATSYTADAWPRLGQDYIYLQMNDTEHMNEVDHTSLENTGVAQDSTGQVSHYFGKLLLNGFGCWAQTFVEAPKTFVPVLGRLERLNFTWTDRHGSLLSGPDANSCDWHMTLRITEIVEVPPADSSLSQPQIQDT